MLLKELFGNTDEVRIIEELIAKWGTYLSTDEISRMSQVSEVDEFINRLNKIEIIDIDENSNKYKLKESDKRALALSLMESEEYLRREEIEYNNS